MSAVPSSDIIDVPEGDAWRTKNGRPQIYIDPRRVEELAYKGLRVTEIAGMLGVDDSTLHARFEKHIRAGRGHRKEELRQQQWNLATAKNGTPGKSAMLIFLGKNELGQADKVEVNHGGTVDHRLEITRMMTDPKLLAEAESHARKMLEAHGVDGLETVEGEVVNAEKPEKKKPRKKKAK